MLSTPPARALRRTPLAALVLMAVACASPGLHVAPPAPSVPCYSRFQSTFQLEDLRRHPDDVEIRATFTAPSGRQLAVGGFWLGDAFAVRFSPQEVGEYHYRIEADGGRGLQAVRSGRFIATEAAPSSHGFLRIHPQAGHQLAFDDGAPFHPLGENRMNIYDSAWNYQQLGIPEYVAYMARHGMNTLRVFIFTDCEREEPTPGPQPGCLETQVGRFDPEVARQYDAILEAAERHGVYVILTPFALGFTPGETWKSWEDNPYNTRNGGLVDSPEAFFQQPSARAAAWRKVRYVLDRWGHSPHLLGVDLLNEPEWDGQIPENTWRPWAVELAEAWHRADSYGHLVTVGSVGLHWNLEGDESDWWADPQADVVQWHLYGAHIYNVHDLAAEMTRKIQESWEFHKPVLVGEFAYGGEDPSTFDHTHVGLWSATFAGAGVLAHSAPPFNLDSDVPMFPERARHFRVLADFLQKLDRSRPLSPLPAPDTSRQGLRAWALGREDALALWVMAPRQGYGQPVRGTSLTVEGLRPGHYRLQWFDDTSGQPLGPPQRLAVHGSTRVAIPPFSRHAAATLTPEPPTAAGTATPGTRPASAATPPPGVRAAPTPAASVRG